MPFPKKLKLQSSMIGLDGGTRTLLFTDEKNEECIVVLRQHSFLTIEDFRKGLPGRLYFDGNLIGIRSEEEKTLLTLLKSAMLPDPPKNILIGDVVEGVSISEEQRLNLIREEAYQRELHTVVSFVESDEYLSVADEVSKKLVDYIVAKSEKPAIPIEPTSNFHNSEKNYDHPATIHHKSNSTDRIRLKLKLIEKEGNYPEGISIGDSFEVTVDKFRTIYIGRAQTADVLVIAPSVGRNVVAIRLEAGGVVVEDLGSGYGSMLEINGIQTERPSCFLVNHSALWIGRVAFRVEILSTEPGAQPDIEQKN